MTATRLEQKTNTSAASKALNATLPAVLPILAAALLAGEPEVNVLQTGLATTLAMFLLTLTLTLASHQMVRLRERSHQF